MKPQRIEQTVHSHHRAEVGKLPPTPRLPVFSWATFSGPSKAGEPCILDRPDVLLTTSGRASILLSMEALGVRAGLQVLMPTYHCPTMIAPVDALGAETVFYPVGPTGAADLDWLGRRDNSRVRVMLAAHFFGLPQPMSQVRAWCDERGIALIEDCAHALYGQVEGRPIGAWGDMAIGSLTKFLPVPEGGCWVANRKEFAPQQLTPTAAVTQVKAALDIVEGGLLYGRLTGLNQLLSTGLRLARALRSDRPSQAPAAGSDGEEPMDGFTIDAVLAHRALSGPSAWLSRWAPRGRNVAHRRRNYQLFADALQASDNLRPLFLALPEHAAPYVFPLWVRYPDPGYRQLRAMQFPVSRWDRLWPSVPRLAGDFGVEWSNHILQLACHQDLGPEDVARMVTVLRNLYEA